MFRRLTQSLDLVVSGNTMPEALTQALVSYLGMVSHADAFELKRLLLNSFGSAMGGERQSRVFTKR